VFNDYMNTLNGDPTTTVLLPLISAAADVGAEVFVVDAGWYSHEEHWWDLVGEWQVSGRRFPDGFGEVVQAIRDGGMRPGLWLEPEVVGVRSPTVAALPGEAFLQRGGVPVVEHGRFHLDLRHPAARAHLDQTVDRLVADFGIAYFKLDYNISALAGTDLDADSPGDGRLQAARAHLDWLAGVLDRHPGLTIENCSSGAMRADHAVLSIAQLQSTSDQQDPALYPPIAASAPASITPEQAGNWAYPQPEMSTDEIVFTLVTGMLGRLYLSGFLDRMSPAQLGLVREAVRAYQRIRAEIAAALPVWPLGLPGWDDPHVALGLVVPDGSVLVSVWNRSVTDPLLELPWPAYVGRSLAVEPIFPRGDDAWTWVWNSESAVLTARTTPNAATARTVRLRFGDSSPA
jgi:alpha-galactosidase